MSQQHRAVSPVISTILVVAIVIVLAATISVFVLGFGENVRDPPPNIAQSNGEFIEQDGYSGGIVRVTHVAGDTVEIENIEILVDVSGRDCTAQDRIVNLPATNDIPDGQAFTDDNFESNKTIISKGFPGGNLFGNEQQWSAAALHTDTGDTMSAGQYFEFRIKGTSCPLSQGDQVTVRVVHLPTNSILIDEELTV